MRYFIMIVLINIILEIMIIYQALENIKLKATLFLLIEKKIAKKKCTSIL